MQVRSYLACAPHEAGVTAAMFYAPWGQSVCGWLAGGHAERCAGVFFAVEGYYSTGNARFCRSVDDDVRGEWIEEVALATTKIRCPISEADCAELSRLQSAFAREWLFCPDNPIDDDEVAAYRKLGLPLRPINVRSTQFRRFEQRRPVWVYASPGIDFNLVLYLKKRPPLNHREARALA
jgi:hypothetical protein